MTGFVSKSTQSAFFCTLSRTFGCAIIGAFFQVIRLVIHSLWRNLRLLVEKTANNQPIVLDLIKCNSLQLLATVKLSQSGLITLMLKQLPLRQMRWILRILTTLRQFPNRIFLISGSTIQGCMSMVSSDPLNNSQQLRPEHVSKLLSPYHI